MKLGLRAIAALLGMLAAIGLGAAPAGAETITIQQFPSAAPNVFGSPSWSGYLANAMNSLENGLGNIGDPSTDPTAYQQLGKFFTPGMIEVTGFKSWMGQANPTGAFANELGNRLHWGVAITDSGGTFTLSDVSFSFTSSDTIGNYSDPTYCPNGGGGSLCDQGNLIGTDFSNGRRIGIAADNTLCDENSSCTDSTPLTALYYVGVGNAFAPTDPADLANTTDYIDANLHKISNTYCVKGTCNTASVSLVPEPASLAIIGAALTGLGLARRRRNA